MTEDTGQSDVTQISIVDAHHHVWDMTRNYHPWLCDAPPIPFRYGDYSLIRKNYLPPDYRRDSAVIYWALGMSAPAAALPGDHAATSNVLGGPAS